MKVADRSPQDNECLSYEKTCAADERLKSHVTARLFITLLNAKVMLNLIQPKPEKDGVDDQEEEALSDMWDRAEKKNKSLVMNEMI